MKKIFIAAAVLAVIATLILVPHMTEDDESLEVGISTQLNGWTWSYDENGDVRSLYGTGTEITAADWPSAVSSMRNTYVGSLDCPNLTTLTIPSRVKIIGPSAFDGCSTITTLTIENGVEEIKSRAFAETGIARVTFPASVINVEPGAFMSCPNLKAISVNSSNTTYKGSGGMLYSADMSLIVFGGGGKTGSLSIPSKVTEIAPYAFYGCSSMTHVTIPSSVVKVSDYAFYGCSGMASISIHEDVETIGKAAFKGCSSLTAVELPYYLETISSEAFAGCTSLAEVEIYDYVTKIESGAFQNCAALGPIMFSKYVASIESKAFSGCTNLTYAVVADETVIAADAFPDTTQILPYIEYTSYPTADMIIRHVSSYTYELSTSTVGRAVWTIGEKTAEGSPIQYTFDSEGEYKVILNVYDDNGIKTHVAERIISVASEDTSEDEYGILIPVVAGLIAAVSAICCYFIPSSRKILVPILAGAVIIAVVSVGVLV